MEGAGMRSDFLLSLFLSSLLAGLCRAHKAGLTADEMLAITSRVTDCEWKAVARYDDGRSTVAQLAERTMGICSVERLHARRAFNLSPTDPAIDLDEFKQAVGIVEHLRKTRQ
jgi:hypothetical protein